MTKSIFRVPLHPKITNTQKEMLDSFKRKAGIETLAHPQADS